MSPPSTPREERRWELPRGPYLESRSQVRVRFQEVDSLQIVWHGHYLTYCEEGRLAFGGEYGLGYDDLGQAELAIPLVHAEVDFHAPARFGETLDVRTRLYPTRAARLEFRYRITRQGPSDPRAGVVLATGFTVHAFTDLAGELWVTRPPRYLEFLERWGSRLEEAAP